MSPSNQPWLRKFDAIIAERAEGLTVALVGADWHEMRDGQPWRVVDQYNLHVQHIARAQEAWRLRGFEPRLYEYRSPFSATGWHEAECFPVAGMVEMISIARTEAQARAWALLRALGGSE